MTSNERTLLDEYLAEYDTPSPDLLLRRRLRERLREALRQPAVETPISQTSKKYLALACEYMENNPNGVNVNAGIAIRGFAQWLDAAPADVDAPVPRREHKADCPGARDMPVGLWVCTCNAGENKRCVETRG